YEDSGQPERGERLRREYLAIVRRARGPESAEVAGALTMLGANLLDRRQYAEAEPVLREGLTIRQARWPDDWVTSHARTVLGAIRPADFRRAIPCPVAYNRRHSRGMTPPRLAGSRRSLPAWATPSPPPREGMGPFKVGRPFLGHRKCVSSFFPPQRGKNDLTP